eukprot:2915601-Pyramimonas_sp.AAC.1
MFRSLKARSMQCSDLACERTFTIQKIEDVSIRDRRGLTRAESVCELGLTVVKNTAALDPSVHRPRVQDAPLDQEALNQEAASMRSMVFGSAPTSTPSSAQQPRTSGASGTGGMGVSTAGTAPNAQSRPGILQGVPSTGVTGAAGSTAAPAPANRPQGVTILDNRFQDTVS